MRKYTIIFFTIISAIIISACEDFLDRKPEGKTTIESFLGNEATADENFEQMIHSAYAPFYVSENSWGSHNHHGEWMTGDWLSDDVQKGGDGPTDFPEVLNWRVWDTKPTASDHLNNTWRTGYFGVSKANVVLQLLERYKAYVSKPTYNRIKGEALFIRAYFYFYLARVYGSVPYFDHPVTPDEYDSPPKIKPAELYAKIESDLTEASQILPSKSSFPMDISPNGRATKGAAFALLARVLSMDIGFNLNGKTWQEVYDATQEVILSGEYNLCSNYAKLFEVDEEETPDVKKEMVFEIICTDLGWETVYGISGGNFENRMVTFRRIEENYEKKLALFGWGFSCPNISLYKAFDQNDIRRECTIIKDSAILWEDGDLTTDEMIRNSISKQCPTGLWTRKFATSYKNTPSINTNGPSNMRKIRYADVLLLCAEAANHLGKDNEALQYLNLVRDRAIASTPPLGSVAGNSGYPEAPKTLARIDQNLSGAALLEAIKNERRLELAVEGNRAWDLIRWGEFEEALKNRIIPEDMFLSEYNANQAIANFRSHMIGSVPTMPIPPDEVEEYKIKQNPGY